MQAAVASRTEPREQASLSDRTALAVSGVVVALLALAYWCSNYFLPGRVSPDLNIYVLRPLIWGGLGLLVLVFWRQMADRPRANRLLLGLAFLAAAFHIAALLCAGLLFAFGNSPYASGALNIAKNLWYIAAFIFGLEMSRAYLLAVWSRYSSAGAFIAVSLLIAGLWIAPGQYEQLAAGNNPLGRTGHIFVPGAAESLLLSFLASIGGPLPAIAYHLSLEAFRWVSPVLPKLQWEIALLVGTLTPGLAMVIVRDAYFAGSEVEVEEVAPSKRRVLSAASLVLATLIVGLIWLNTGMLGVRPALVSGPSMKPYLGPGDVVMIKDVEPAELRVGDVVMFKVGSRDVVHRIVAIGPGVETLMVQTQGDNNNTADPPLPADAIEGKVVLKVPYVGWLPIEIGNLLD